MALRARDLALRLALVVSAVGCGGGPGPVDGGQDGGAPDLDAANDARVCSATLPSSECPCAREGDVLCIGGGVFAYRCLGGAWSMFADGECWGPAGTGLLDAGHDGGGGPSRCLADPRTPGCACACPQERVCSAGMVDVHCIDGTWRRGFWACTPGPMCRDAGP